MKVFLHACQYSPFDFPGMRKRIKDRHNIQVVGSHKSADVIMSSYFKYIMKYVAMYGNSKKYLLWTHEPYHDWHLNSTEVVNGPKGERVVVHVMNVYTGDVFTHNFRYFYFRNPVPLKKIEDGHSEKLVFDGNGQKKIVVLSTYFKLDYYDGNERTCFPLRYQVIEEGWKRGLVDVHGKNWQRHDSVRSVGNTRNDDDRRKSKEEIIRAGYWFNICLENSEADWYVTEKIWEAIKFGTLPIYRANGTIGKVFPDESYVNVKDYGSVEEMYDAIQQMTIQEYKERYNRCAKAFNDVIAKGQNNRWRGKSKNLNINYLEYESCLKNMVERLKQI